MAKPTKEVLAALQQQLSERWNEHSNAVVLIMRKYGKWDPNESARQKLRRIETTPMKKLFVPDYTNIFKHFGAMDFFHDFAVKNDIGFLAASVKLEQEKQEDQAELDFSGKLANEKNQYDGQRRADNWNKEGYNHTLDAYRTAFNGSDLIFPDAMVLVEEVEKRKEERTGKRRGKGKGRGKRKGKSGGKRNQPRGR